MAFHEVRLPARLAFGSTGGVERRTEITTLGSGFERRSTPWAEGRRRYLIGRPGRSRRGRNRAVPAGGWTPTCRWCATPNWRRPWRAGPTGAPPGGAGFTEAAFTWEARSARPWRPAHLRATVEGGGRRLTWTPRVRIGGDRWDLEPAEVDPRRFRVRVLDDGVEKRVWEVEGLETVYAAGLLAADFPGGVGAGARIAVAQWGEGYGWGTEAVVGL